MAFLYNFKHGKKSDIPLLLPADYKGKKGEPYLTTDTNEMFIGWGPGSTLTQLNANKAISLYGQTCSISEINYLSGTNANVQAQIDTINLNKVDKASIYTKTEVDNLYNHLMITKLQIADFEQGITNAINNLRGVANGIAPLDENNHIPTSYLGDIAMSAGRGVASDAEQIALGQDILVAIRTDQNKTYVRNGNTSGTLADWIQMKTPTDAVTSVNGKVGIVTLFISDISGLTDALTAKSDVGHQHEYNDILNLPDLTVLHEHTNLNVLNKLSEMNGVLQYNGSSIVSNNVINKMDAIKAPTINNDVIEGYTIGSKWYDIVNCMEYVCFDNSVGAAKWKNTTSMDGDTGMPKLYEVDQTVVVAANSILQFDFNIGCNKYDIRTIYCKSLEGNDIVISLYDKEIDGFKLYSSLIKNEIYDILNIPCQDKDITESIHVSIENKGSIQTTVKVNIKATSLA